MRTLGSLFATLIVVGVVAHFIWWLIAAVAVGIAYRLLVAYGPSVWASYKAYRLRMARREALVRRSRDRLVARAWQQHQWRLQGDERGTYGDWPPAML